jgi:C1A family cysteine protease
MQVFMDSLKYISENQGDTYTLGVNQFADITNEEFRSTYLGYVANENQENENGNDFSNFQGSIPTSVNWVEAGVVPAILNQAQCGSCWAFSAAGSISMAYNVQNGNNATQLSPEQLVQCSKAYGNNGCNGGLMDNAFQYAQKYPLATYA